MDSIKREERIETAARNERTKIERDAFIRGAQYAITLKLETMTKDEVFENAAKAGISKGLLRSPNKSQPLYYARVAVAYKLQQLGMSSTAIGRELNRHHSSVVLMWGKAKEWFDHKSSHKYELQFMDDVLNGRTVYIPEPKLVKRYAPNELREALCVECVAYPCFKGIENISSNLAETCRHFRQRRNGLPEQSGD